MRRKLLLIMLFGVCFVVVFVIAIFLTLPTDSIRHFAEKTLEKQLKEAQTVEIEDLSISPLLNVTVKNFQMRPRNPETVPENLRTAGGEFSGYYCAPYVEQAPVVIDEAFVNPSLFKTLKGKPQGSFELKIQDGVITGEVKNQDDAMAIDAMGEGISLNEFPLLSNYTKMQIHGGLQFDVHAVMAKKTLAELQLNMNATTTALCPTRIKLNTPSLPFIELPFTVFGNITADIEIDGDKVIINALKSDGPDIKLDVTGDVTLKSGKNPNPRLNISAVITPSESWVTDNNMKSIYKLCEKHDDGSIHLKVTGTTKKPKTDCGTPIPEPEPEPEPSDAGADVDKARDSAKDVKKDAEKPKEPEKKEAPRAEEKAEAPEDVIKGPVREIDPESVMKPERRLDDAMRRDPPSSRRSSRSGTPRMREDRDRRLDELDEKLDQQIDREIRRRNRTHGQE